MSGAGSYHLPPMARLSDMPVIFKSVGFIPFARRVWDEIGRDNLFVWASALAYSWLFAIFPFFIFLLAMIPYLPQSAREPGKNQIKAMLADLLPTVANSTIWKDIEDNPDNMLNRKLVRGPMLYVSLLLALWAASGGTATTMAALDRCYELDRGRNFYLHRLMAVALTVIVAALLLAVVCLFPLAGAVKRLLLFHGHGFDAGALVLVDIGRWAVSLFLMVSLLTIIYYKGPAIRHHFSFMTPGAAFATVVWIGLGLLFRLYVNRIGAHGYSQTYGTVGGVAILLLFFYLDALVLLIGAEINAEVDFEVLRVRRGSRDFRNREEYVDGAPTSC